MTQLQKFCEQFENASYLNEASNQEFEPCMKMAYVIAFCVQGLLSSKNRCHFPFPSLLGETYELDYKEDQIKFKFLSEQINIDPNTIAYHCKSDTFEAWGTVIYEFNYWGKSFEIEPRGVNYIRLNNGNNFVYSNAYKIKTFNLENDNPQTCIEGDITFENLETKDHGDITFRKESLVSTNYNFMGSIKNSKGETKFRLFGIWNSTFIVQNTQTKKSIELWKKPNVSDSMLIIDSEQTAFSDFALQLNFLNMDLIEKLPLSDSRFRSDVKALELGEIKFANEEKNRIDGIQNEKMSEKFQYKPKFFEENKEKNENRKEYIFKGNYWKLKEDGKLGDYIDSLF